MAKVAQNIFSSLFFIFLSVTIYISSNNIKSLTDMGVGPDLFPKAASVLLFVLSLILGIQGIVNLRKVKRENKENESLIQFVKETVLKKTHMNASITVILFLIYVYGISKIGFLLSSILYLILHFLILSERKLWNIPLFIILAIGFSALVFYSFREGFSVRLPTM